MTIPTQTTPLRAAEAPVAGRLVLAGVDTLHFSADIQISDAVRAKLDQEKEVAQSQEMAKTAHCPEWLGAWVHPHGARGGYAHLLETDDFSVKILGTGILHRPGLYVPRDAQRE